MSSVSILPISNQIVNLMIARWIVKHSDQKAFARAGGAEQRESGNFGACVPRIIHVMLRGDKDQLKQPPEFSRLFALLRGPSSFTPPPPQNRRAKKFRPKSSG